MILSHDELTHQSTTEQEKTCIAMGGGGGGGGAATCNATPLAPRYHLICVKKPR